MWTLKVIVYTIFYLTLALFLRFYFWKMIRNKFMFYRAARTCRKIAKRQKDEAVKKDLMVLSDLLTKAAKEEGLTDHEQ